jgi:hypothetical protein
MLGMKAIHTTEPCDLFRLSDTVRRWEEHATRIGELRQAYKIVVRKCERKRPKPGRPRCRLQNNIEKYLNEMECGGVNYIQLAQDGVS